MIPAKLVETMFQKYWALLIPIILVPFLALSLTRSGETYRSTAVIWVSQPVAGESLTLGHSNPYLTPAQNQAQVINDLLATEAFRVDVLNSAGLVKPDTDPKTVQRAARSLVIYAGSRGTNLVTVVAETGSADVSQALVAAVLTEYEDRATSAFERSSVLTEGYYTQQLAIASQELAVRQSALSNYVAENPDVLDPRSSASLSLDYRTLVDRVDSQSRLVETLNDAIQAINLRSASAPEAQAAAFSVQDPASRPDAPLPSSVAKTYGLPLAAVVFGTLIGCAYVYFAYRTDHTIRGAAELEALDVPLLGSVPDLRAGPGILSHTPFGWALTLFRRDFARKTAASIIAKQPVATDQPAEG